MNSNNSISNINQKKKISFQAIFRSGLFRGVIKYNEIKGGQILILYYEFFQIYDIKTNKGICHIDFEFIKDEESRCDDKLIKDFIELKNTNLIFWSKGKIFYYKKN